MIFQFTVTNQFVLLPFFCFPFVRKKKGKRKRKNSRDSKMSVLLLFIYQSFLTVFPTQVTLLAAVYLKRVKKKRKEKKRKNENK